MIDVNKKILWLADFDLNDAPGGAQRSDKILIDKGILLGFNILKLTFSNYDSNIDFNNFDIIVTSNIHALSVKDKNLIDKISNHKYHVRLEHDSNAYLSADDRIKLFSSCKKTIFLSEFHHLFFKKLYGDFFKNVEIIYDPIATSLFKDLKQQREDKILYAGYLHPLKGAYEFFEAAITNPDKQFVVAGWTDNHVINHLLNSIKNIENLGKIDYENMPSLYNKYKNMFYNPNLNEPFCRSIAEAILCGMSIITKKQNQIGCIHEISKHGTEKFKENCASAAYNFWNKI